uniref:Alpha 1,4-glycosyltransferase domain-containing protein n=1 Tax=viral metagenome TaxID=1070528 RepID=A0A6C0J4U2_9ZZZZ
MVFENAVFSMWIGTNELSILEQSCINSFLEKGTSFTLYVYDNLNNIPHGTIVKDGNMVVPKKKYEKYNNPSYFSNLFRYTLLYEIGGIWVDMDMICLKPLDIILDQDYIFSCELKNNNQHTNAGIIGCPSKSDLMKDCINEVKKLVNSNKKIVQGLLGPKVLKKFVTKYELDYLVSPYYVFCHYGYKEIEKIYYSYNFQSEILDDKEVLCIHLWNNVIQNTIKDYPKENSLYYYIVNRFKPDPDFLVNHNYECFDFKFLSNEISGSFSKNNKTIICYDEYSAYYTKQCVPSLNIVLVKKTFNKFIYDVNTRNNNVYKLIDVISYQDYKIRNTQYKNRVKTVLENI